jgi:endonuclease-3 related protein
MSDPSSLAVKLMDIYDRFYIAYGPQYWWPGDSPFEVIIGAILTQSAAWTNVEMALANMKLAGCWSLESVSKIPKEELALLVRPSGYFNAKARKLKAFADHVTINYQGDLDLFLSKRPMLLRKELLSIYGIGEETADDIMVYAAGQPSFVIDTYTRRIMDRIGITPDAVRPKYADYQAVFHSYIPQQNKLYNEYHALWDRHGKDVCTKVSPSCEVCCLLDVCSTGQRIMFGL